MEILERAPVLLEMSHLLHKAAGGRGRIVFLGGEAGIGKTALVRRFARMVDGSARTLWGACDPLSTPRPLGPLLDMQERLGPRFTDLLARQTEKDVLFRAFLAELSAGPAPALVVFEDVHWADEATLDLLRFLGRRMEQTPALLLATYRDDEVGDRHPLRVVLGDVATQPAVHRLTLQPLSLAAVRTLCAGTALDPERLHRQTDGNPFYVTEVIAAGGAGIPATVRDAVLARASRLPPVARAALDTAAVLGVRFESGLLEEVAAAPPEAIDDLLASGMLRAEGDRLAFGHELTRQAILEALSPHWAHALHRAALAELRTLPDGSVEPGRLAHHADGARDAEAVLAYAPLAARRARDLHAHREAAAQFALALRYARDSPAAFRAPLLDALAYEYYLIHRIPDAIEARSAALDLWCSLEDPLREGDDLRWLSRLYWFIGDAAEAERAGRLAIEVLERLPPGPELAMAHSNWAQLRMLAHDITEAIEWGERAIALAESLGDMATLAHALNNVGTARLHVEDESGLALLERSLELSLAGGLEEHVARAYTNLASSRAAQYLFEAAARYLADGLAYCRERELDSWRLYLGGWHAIERLYRGHWAEAQAIAEAVRDHPSVTPISVIQALVVLGRIASRSGRGVAAAALDPALELAEPTRELQRLGPVRAARAEAAWLAGDPGGAAEEARAALDLALERQHPWFAGELLSWLHRAGEAVEVPDWIARPFALQIGGAWEEAAAEWERRGCSYEAAQARLESGVESEVRRALAEFERLGARPAAQLAAQRLRGLGARRIPRGPRSSTRGNPAQLTRRQVEIARLLAEGLQNGEIARRLFLSPKTVDHHVSAVLAKLGVHTRAEAAREAERLGILQDGASVAAT